MRKLVLREAQLVFTRLRLCGLQPNVKIALKWTVPHLSGDQLRAKFHQGPTETRQGAGIPAERAIKLAKYNLESTASLSTYSLMV